MHLSSKVVAAALAVTLGNFGFGALQLAAPAAENAVPDRSPRGAQLATSEHWQFEVFFYSTGVRVFIRNTAGEPVSATGLGGTITFYHPNSPAPWFTRTLSPTMESLDLRMNLSGVPRTSARAAFDIAGLPDTPGGSIRFITAVEFIEPEAQSISITESAVPVYLATTPNILPVNYPTTYVTFTSRGPVYFGHYHIRDWTTGIEKPSYVVSKPWLNVRQYP